MRINGVLSVFHTDICSIRFSSLAEIFSEPVDEGLKTAKELASQYSAEMLLVHVVTPPAGHTRRRRADRLSHSCCPERVGKSAKSSLEEIRSSATGS
jgi:hypothetical protein